MKDTYTKLPSMICFWPSYAGGSGDLTRFVTFKGEEQTDQRALRGFRTALCRQYAVDFVSLGRKYHQLCGRGLVPLLLAEDYAFMPIKTRNALVGGDACYGYVNIAFLHSVEKAKEAPYQSILVLEGDQRIKCLTSVETVRQNQRRCQMFINEHFRQQDFHRRQRQELLELVLKLLEEKAD